MPYVNVVRERLKSAMDEVKRAQRFEERGDTDIALGYVQTALAHLAEAQALLEQQSRSRDD